MSDAFLSKISGLIHVGANEGQERDLYASHGLKVLWVEALPDVHAILKKNLADLPHQRSVQGLVTDRPGQTMTFHVSNNQSASSSIYDFALHRDIWPDVTFTHDVELVSTTLDTIVTETGLDLATVDALIMDTQGSELLVLKGAQRVLKRVDYVKTEAADFESYKGCTTVAELETYLAGHGFALIDREPFADHPGGGHYFELLFKKRHGPMSRLRRFLHDLGTIWRGAN